jgi:HD-GYP domain-containing protein (c-di-GMP phosphodiesterase class II)
VSGGSIALSEVLGGLSVAADLGAGAPSETGIGSALLAGRLGQRLGLPEVECAELFYASLLRFIGCSVGVPDSLGVSLGDTQGYQLALTMSDLRDPEQVAKRLDHFMAVGADADARATSVGAMRAAAEEGEKFKGAAQSLCELGARLADDIGMAPIIVDAMNEVYERWDGRGFPHGRPGEELCLPARVLHITAAFELHRRTMGMETAFEEIGARRGSNFDPLLCDAFTTARGELMKGFEAPTLLDLFIDEAPGDLRIDESRLIDVAKACAHFVDHRSIYTLGHSVGVANLVARASEAAELTQREAEDLHIAAYLHDLGRVGVHSGIWHKPGELTRSERAKVEQHTYLTDTILRASPAFERHALLASSHHERKGGRGYHRRTENPDRLAQILAAADTYHAMLEDRPHRMALGEKAAADALLAEAKEGRLGRMEVRAVLDAVSGRRASKRALPDGLTKREAEVLCLMARGLGNKDIAGALFISHKTVEHHVGHIYDKIDTRSRASAAMYAVQHGLCAAVEG